MPIDTMPMDNMMPRRPPRRMEGREIDRGHPTPRSIARESEMEDRFKSVGGSAPGRLNRAGAIPSADDIPDRRERLKEDIPTTRREMLSSGGGPRPAPNRRVTLDDSDLNAPPRRTVTSSSDRHPLEDDMVRGPRPSRRPSPGVALDKDTDDIDVRPRNRETKEKINIKNVKPDDFQEAIKITGKKVGKKVIDQVLDPVRLKDLLIAPIIVYKSFIRGLQGSLDDRLEFKDIYQYCIYVIVGALAIGLITQRPRQCFEVCMGVVAFIALVHWITYDSRESGRKILEYLLIDLRNINLNELTGFFRKISKLLAKKPKPEPEEDFDIERTGEDTVRPRGFKNKFIEVTPVNNKSKRSSIINDEEVEDTNPSEDINTMVGVEVSEDPVVGAKINEALDSCGPSTEKVTLTKTSDTPQTSIPKKPVLSPFTGHKTEPKVNSESEDTDAEDNSFGRSKIPMDNPLKNPVPSAPPNIKPTIPQASLGEVTLTSRTGMPSIPGAPPKPTASPIKGSEFLVGRKALSRQPSKVDE